MLPELYHAYHSLHMEDLHFWLGLADQAGDPILELGCGTGRILIPLVQAGYKCMGIDHDLEMLRFLRSGVSQGIHPKPDLLAADVTCFNLAIQFPLIIFPCNTFSTLEAKERNVCLENIRRHMNTGGIFAVSLPNPELLNHLPIRSGIELEDEFIHPQTGNPVQVSSAWRRTSHSFSVNWVYDQLFPNGTVVRTTLNISQQLVNVEDYLHEIKDVGLRVLSLYGDFDRSTYSANSPELIILATI